MIDYTIYESDKELIVELNCPKDSCVDFPFLSGNNFSEINISYPEEKLLVKFEKTQASEQLLKGIVVNGKYYPLIRTYFEQEDIRKREEKLIEKGIFRPLEKRLDESLPIDHANVYQKILKEDELKNLESIDPENLWTDPESGEVVDKTTGEVLGYEFKRTRDWRAFDLEQRIKRERVGRPFTFTRHDKGLTTFIDWKDEDAYGRKLSLKERYRATRLRKWQKRMRVAGAGELNLALSLAKIKKQCEDLNLPEAAIETACQSYRRAGKQGLIRGRDKEAVEAAAIYMACRLFDIPKGLYEIAQSYGLEKEDVGRAYRDLKEKLGYEAKIQEPSLFIKKLVNKFNLSSKAEEIGIKIIQTAKRYLPAGRNPLSSAGAATYIASVLTNKKIIQREIANELNVTEVTVRNRYKEIWENLLFEVKI
jgi:transcription initiation factor TFIIB